MSLVLAQSVLVTPSSVTRVLSVYTYHPAGVLPWFAVSGVERRREGLTLAESVVGQEKPGKKETLHITNTIPMQAQCTAQIRCAVK